MQDILGSAPATAFRPSQRTAIPPHEAWDLLRFFCRYRVWISFGVEGERPVARFCPMEEAVAHRLLREMAAETDAARRRNK